MDYILSKINEDIEINTGYARVTLLKERVEYSLVLALGYLYYKNIQRLEPSDMMSVNENLQNMTFGKLISSIRLLDTENEFYESKKKKYSLIDQYTSIRNEYIGHGYIHGDALDELEDAYSKYYEELYYKIKWFSKKKEFVLITEKNNDNCIGIRFDDNNKKKIWMADRDCIEKEVGILKINDLLLFIEGNYYKIRPFVYMENKGYDIYLFSSLKDKRSGQIKMCMLLNTNSNKFILDPLFVCKQIENDNYRISETGTIMNKFEINYKNYMETPIESDILDYLKNNTSNVQATLWGHGGVGKTAAVQYVCESLFYGEGGPNCKFDYIVFATAKNRRFDPKSGKIVDLENLKSYDDIIKLIISMVDEKEIGNDPKSIIESEDIIANAECRILIVIDDYETFSDNDKQAIQEFIRKLNIEYHRVIITTRNKRLANGIPIQTNEFGKDVTVDFFKRIIKNDYPQYEKIALDIIANKQNCDDIYLATEGRAISILHFVNLLVQRGFSKELLEELHSSESMSQFLYDRIYDLLSEEVKIVFGCISLLVKKDSLIFSLKTLEFVIDGLLHDTALEDAIEELVSQKVIENTGSEFVYRVYTEKILDEMKKRYAEMDSSKIQFIKNKETDLGGSFEVASVEDALLSVARKTRIIGTHDEAKQKYLQIIKSKKYSIQTKYLAKSEYLDLEMGIDGDSSSLLRNKKYFLNSDDKTNRLNYIKALWNKNDIKGKEEALNIVMRPEDSSLDINSYEFYALRILYGIPFYLNKYKDSKDVEYKKNIIKLIETDGYQLLNFVKKHLGEILLNSHSSKIALECTEAFLSIIGITCDLFGDDEQLLKKMKYYVEFLTDGKCINSADWNRAMELRRKVLSLLGRIPSSFEKRYPYGSLFVAKIDRIFPKYIRCRVLPSFSVVIFDIASLPELKKGDLIYGKIKNINQYHEIEITYEGFAE